MNKTFKDINVGDKVYVISIQNSKFEHKDGEPVMKSYVVTSKSNCNYGYNASGRTYSMALDSGTAFFPGENESANVFNNSYDTTGFKKVNSTIYGTTKRDCIEKAMSMIKNSWKEQEEVINRLSEVIKSNANMLSFLEKELETADFPDTVLEFAEMALT